MAKATIRDIGIDVAPPPRAPAAGDRMNPFNGSLPVRGFTLVGNVVSNRMQSTVIVAKQRMHYVKKFERYEKRTSRFAAHLPSNIDVDVGDEVTIAECRPLSKTVKFVVVENRTKAKPQGDGPAASGSEPAPAARAPAKSPPKPAAKAPAKAAKPAKPKTDAPQEA